MGTCFGVSVEKTRCILYHPWYQLQRFLRRITTIGEARDHVPFDSMEHMSQILGIGTVGRLLVTKR